MDRRAGSALLATGGAVLAALLIVAVVAVPPPSRSLTIEELRAGVDIELGGVRIQQTYFRDLSPVDGGTQVAFLMHFSDGTSENLSFVFQTPICVDAAATSTHREPQVVFHTECGESSVLVTVL